MSEVGKAPESGQGVHFFRDKEFPGPRGPWSAKVLTVYPQLTGPPLLDVQVIGDQGGVFTEHRIPYLTGQFEDPGTRYCTELTKKT